MFQPWYGSRSEPRRAPSGMSAQMTEAPAHAEVIPQRRVLFISHRHDDAAIADEIRRWIDLRTGDVTVYQSSAPGHGIDPGEPVRPSLQDQLFQSQVVLCIYTGPHKDWSWCMWECGLATHPLKMDTRIVVLQFSDEFPAPQADLKRVNVRRESDVVDFAFSFFTSPDFFPGFHSALRPRMSGDEPTPQVRGWARDLFTALNTVCPAAPEEQWASWAILLLEFPNDSLDQLRTCAEEERVNRIKALLLETCKVVDAERTGRNVFNFLSFPPEMPFSEIYNKWHREYPTSKSRWLDSLANQISYAVRREDPATELEIVEAAAGGTGQYSIPLVGWTVYEPAFNRTQFHLYFIPVKGVDPSGRFVQLGYPDPPAQREP